MDHDLHITGDPDADRLLSTDPLALLFGMLLDQQVAMETAFSGPKKLVDRLGGLDPATIAGLDAEEFAAICAAQPAVHRFPGSMAGRLQALSSTIVSDWDGLAEAIWTRGDPDGAEVLRRVMSLPGFGDQKARIFVALLGKRYGFAGSGWRAAAGDYGAESSFRSVADIVDHDSLLQVRENKKAAKAAAKH